MNLLLLEEGLVAMCIGMGVVLSFLIVLIVAMSVMSKIVIYLNKIFPEALPVPVKSRTAPSVKEDEQIAIAIAAIMARA